MTHKMILKQVRILLDEPLDGKQVLTLQLTASQHEFNYHPLHWNAFCRRWQCPSEICLQLPSSGHLHFSLFRHKHKQVDCLVAQTGTDLSLMARPTCNQVKLCLRLDGIVVGWLYFQLNLQEGKSQNKQQYIYIHKLAISFLENQEECSVAILLNTKIIFHKPIKLTNRSRTLYPNIKHPVKKSDLVSFQISTKSQRMQPISLLIDHIKCGETTFMNIWIRSHSKKKRGQISLEYFLDSIYFENDHKFFTRKIQTYNTNNQAIPVNIRADKQPNMPRKSIEKCKEEEEMVRKSTSLKKTILCSSKLRLTVQRDEEKTKEVKQNGDGFRKPRKDRANVGRTSFV